MNGQAEDSMLGEDWWPEEASITTGQVFFHFFPVDLSKWKEVLVFPCFCIGPREPSIGSALPIGKFDMQLIRKTCLPIGKPF